MVLPIAGLLMIVAVAILFVRTIWRRRPEPKEGPAPVHMPCPAATRGLTMTVTAIQAVNSRVWWKPCPLAGGTHVASHSG